MNIDSLFLWDKVLSIALEWPQVIEKTMHDTPALYVHKKFFVRLKEDGESIAVYNNEADIWIESNPDIFYITDHYKGYAMLLVHLSKISRKDLSALLMTSWKIRASKTILKNSGL